MSADLLASNLAAHWIQSGLVVAAALAAMTVLRVKEPRLRLALFQFILLVILALPFVQPWESQPLVVYIAANANSLDGEAAMSSGSALQDEPVPLFRARQWLDQSLIVAVVVMGVVMRLLWLFYGVLTLTRFGRRATILASPAAAEDLERRIGVALLRYIEQTPGRGPCTFGFLRSTIALPADFQLLPHAFQRAIICHELLHVKRRDIVTSFLEELVVAALWFHPWVWLLRARIRIAREQVIDRSVVTFIGDRDEYVKCLVEISGHDLVPHLSHAGAGLLRPRELRARIDAIFQEVRMSPRHLAAVATTFAIVLGGTGWMTASTVPLRALNVRYVVSEPSDTAPSPVAPVPSRSQSPASAEAPRRQMKIGVSEYPADALEKRISGTVMVAITVNAAGQVTTASIVSGPQELRASAFKAAMGVTFAPGDSTTAMTLPIQYALTDNSWGVYIGAMGGHVVRRGGFGRTAESQRLETENLKTEQQPLDSTGAVRVGGAIQPPRKIADVPPQYPAEALEAKVQGVVILEVRIDENGNVSDTRTLRSILLLDQAAIDAVKQWRYTPTLINGVPVPVIMTVTVNFTMRNAGPGTSVRLNVSAPEGYLRSNSPVALTIRTNDVGVLQLAKDNIVIGFVPIVDDASPGYVRVGIYRMNPEDGSQPQFLGSVDVAAGGSVAQSPTNPSFGIELLTIESR
jgi:TonB family protein